MSREQQETDGVHQGGLFEESLLIKGPNYEVWAGFKEATEEDNAMQGPRAGSHRPVTTPQVRRHVERKRLLAFGRRKTL